MKQGKDCIGVFVTAVCHNGKGEFLMSKRSEKARDNHGVWEFGGGTVEIGESMIEALRREYLEELSIELSEVRQIDVRDVIGENGHWIGVFYVAKIEYPEKIRIADESIAETGWFTLENFPDNIQTGDREKIPEYIKYIT